MLVNASGSNNNCLTGLYRTSSVRKRPFEWYSINLSPEITTHGELGFQKSSFNLSSNFLYDNPRKSDNSF